MKADVRLLFLGFTRSYRHSPGSRVGPGLSGDLAPVVPRRGTGRRGSVGHGGRGIAYRGKGRENTAHWPGRAWGVRHSAVVHPPEIPPGSRGVASEAGFVRPGLSRKGSRVFADSSRIPRASCILMPGTVPADMQRGAGEKNPVSERAGRTPQNSREDDFYAHRPCRLHRPGTVRIVTRTSSENGFARF